MHIKNVINPYIIEYQQNFKTSSDALSTAQNSQTEIKTKKQEQSFFKKVLTHSSLIIVPFFPEGCYEVYVAFKETSLKKQLKKGLIKENKLREFNKTALKTSIALFLAAIPLYFATDYINKKYKDKNFNKASQQIDDFNKKNGTTLKLIPRIGKNVSNIEVASFDPLSAQVLLTEKVPEDILYSNIKQKHIINHELIHAQQHILMACSENGIKKMNYIIVKRLSNKFNDKQKSAILDSYQEIKNTKNDEYKKKTVTMNNYQVNYVDYVTALYKVLYDKDVNLDNVPIIINKEFYEKAKAVKGSLTQDEEKKAQAYLEAYEKYPENVGFMQALNSNSDYKQNLLEKEAFKAIPWYTNVIMNLLYLF